MNSVIKGLRYCLEHGTLGGQSCRGHYIWASDEHKEIVSVDSYHDGCPYHDCETGCVVTLCRDAVELLEQHEREIDQREREIDQLSEMYSDVLDRLLEDDE